MSKPAFYGKPMDVAGIEPSPLPWYVGTGRGHHEMIYGADGSLAAQGFGGHGPFKRDASGISDYSRREYVNAELVVRAVNTHDVLLDACEAALAICEGRAAGTYDDIMHLMRSVIAKAKGGAQ